MFTGTFTALVTPFNEDGSFDEAAYRKLIEKQISSGVEGIVPCGTTGESPTLNHEEHDHVIEVAVDQARGRVPVIAGAGSNSTAEAITRTEHAKKAGADAVLQVNPYYNKPTQHGLYLHFKAIADAVNIPNVLYNIQGRTAVNLETPTLLKLIKDCKNIVAVKEASGNMEQIKEVIARVPDSFSVLSGDDNLTLDLIKAGGHGVISVASNLVPGTMSVMVREALLRKWEQAESFENKLKELFDVEFIETNPQPIKTALAMRGECKEVFRLPLCSMEPENKEKVKAVIEKLP